MSRLVVLKLSGDIEQSGFQVTLDVAQDGHYPALSEEGELPANPELVEHLNQWRNTYTDLSDSCRAIKPYKVQVAGSIHPLVADCQDSADQLAQTFKQWLKTDSFRDLDIHLRRVLSPEDTVRVLIRSKDSYVHALPWHLWPFFDEYPNAEVAMGAPRFQRAVEDTPYTLSETPKVNILAVLGDRQNIDLETDRALLSALPGAKVTLLVEPTLQELNDQLYTQSWDILFFAGHSDTNEHQQGILQLNPDTALTLEYLTNALSSAIRRGLQLAIFNSCKGLGLAQALAELQIPQLIVMREAIPDHVAHTFLKYFLNAFSKGNSLYQSVRAARERLESMEQDYPCASWLPVLYQHPAKTPPSWRSLQRPSRFLPPSILHPSRTLPHAPLASRLPLKSLTYLATTSFIVTTLVMVARFLGLWQPFEFWAFDQLMRSRPAETPDDRIVIITIDESDYTFQQEHGYSLQGSLSNQALAEAFSRLEPYNPRVIGVDIFRNGPLLHDHSLADSLFICYVQAPDLDASDIPPPTNIPIEQIGFSNIPRDPDRVVRRHLIGMSPSDVCNTDKSFSYQVANNYLTQDDHAEDRYRPQLSDGLFSIGTTSFPALEPHTGAYHRADMGGYEFLLNYRATNQIASMMSLEDLLTGKLDDQLAELVGDRIVLIGTIARSFQDYHQTPLGEISGVEIQAHMISQMISAVLDDRPLLRSLPQWGDAFWIFLWTFSAGGVAYILHSRYLYSRYLLMGSIIIIITSLSGICAVALRSGLWLPLMPTAIACIVVMAEIHKPDFLVMGDRKR
jgi:CHASE2 domain-containing sensor protein